MSLDSSFYSPRLVIIKQNCLSEEIIPNNGEPYTVNVVVKHSPFNVQLTVQHESGCPAYDLSCLSFDVKLIYDSAEEKEVDRVKPLEFKVKVDESGLFVNIECRLKVLTSQLEDMFFRLRFIALDPISKREISPQLQVTSAPIKVISKPEQLRKNIPSQKRKANEFLSTSLDRIENFNQGNKKLLEQLDQRLTALLEVHSQIEGTIKREQEKTQPLPPKELTLEQSFTDLMSTFDSIAPPVRSKKMRLALEKERMSIEYITEVVDLFSSEGLQRPIGNEVGNSNAYFQPLEECQCPVCPHREELQKIEQFYNVFSV